jgi:hypothetical protein
LFRISRFVALAVVVVAMVSTTALPVAAPPPMMPLAVGNLWHYVSAAGVHQVETITGTQTLLGRTVFVKTYRLGPDAGLENYWLTGPNGEVLLAGFSRPGLAFAYDPPMTVCGGAPLPGDSWHTRVTLCHLPDLTVQGVFDVTFGVIEDVSLDVPAGTFHCVGVGETGSATPALSAAILTRGLTLDGRTVAVAATESSAAITDWYSAGMGDVQYAGSDTFQLAAFGSTTPTVTTSWGALKASYR